MKAKAKGPEVCWCGLPQEHHDGREMDANGDMHQFNQSVRPQRRAVSYEDPKPRPALHQQHVGLTLHEVHRFLERIVRMAQNGAVLPGGIANDASRLDVAIKRLLDIDQPEAR